MKTAVIGTGKTGSEILPLLKADEIVGPFSTSHPLEDPTQLREAEVCVIFVPGPAALNLIPKLLETKIPCVWGSTGFEWPQNLDDQLKKLNITWVYARNFSFLINLLAPVLNILGQAKESMPEIQYKLSEVHHSQKKDAPSGTAKQWQEWLDLDENLQIQSQREGDVVGIHKLELSTPFEKLTLEHTSHERKLFAHGALTAAKLLLAHKNELPKELISFDQLLSLLGEKL